MAKSAAIKKLENRRGWQQRVNDRLRFRVITRVRPMTEKECKDFDWYERGWVVFLARFGEKGSLVPDGHLIISCDDEGNGPGAVFTSFDDLPTLRVLPL
jgi:hypothetical protein